MGIAALCLWIATVEISPIHAAQTIVSYTSGGWRYLQVAVGDLAGFETGVEPLGFADGSASFGTGGGCPLDATVQTHWDSSTDMLLRRTLSLPNGAQGVEIGVAIDNDVQVWFNGVDISGGMQPSGGCAELDRFVFPVPNGLILSGDNLLAIRARDDGGDALVDVRVAAAVLNFAPCVPAPAGLLANWSGENSGDDSFGGHNGQLVGNVGFSPGKAGKAFLLDGSSYVEAGNPADFNFSGNSSMSVELWAYRTGSEGVMHLVGKRAGCDGSIQYQMAFDGGGLGFGGSGGSVGTGLQMPLNTWMHLAATADGSTLSFYINGKLVASTPGALGPANDTPLRIAASGSCGQFFHGLLDEVAIYNRALSGEEIAAIFASGAAGKCFPSAHPDLGVALLVKGGAVRLGDSVPLEVTVANSGAGLALDTQLTLKLPTGLRVLPNTDPRFTFVNDHVNVAVGGVASGAQLKLTFDVVATRPGDQALEATVTSANADNGPADNRATGVVTVNGTERVLFVNIAGAYDADGQNYFQTLLNAGADATFVQLDHDGAAAMALALGQYDQIWVYDLSGGADDYPSDYQAIADWFAGRPAAQIICDGRIISSYWVGRYLGEGQQLTENYLLNLAARGGGLVLGTDDANFVGGINELNRRLGITPFFGIFNLSQIPVDTANPLMKVPNDLGPELYDDSSPSQTPFGLQDNGRILYTIARHSGDVNTPGISSTISGAIGLRVAITSPAPGTVLGEGMPVTLRATTTAGTEPINFIWRSDRVTDPLGTGAELVVPRLPLGAQTLTVLATDASGGADSASVRITVQPLSDLVVTDVTAPSEALAGQPLVVHWTVKNRGTVATSSAWTETVALSDDNAIGGDLALTSVNIKSALAPGESVTRSATVLLPAGSAGGRYLVVTTDSAGQVAEIDETNNSGIAANPTRLVAADLVVDSVTVTPPAAGVNLVVNGDFEEPVIGAVSFSELRVGDSRLTG